MVRNAMLRDFLTGLFALGSIAGLCALLMLFGEMTALGEKHYRFYLVLPTAQGLGPTSPVNVNGVKVGQVEEAKVVPAGARLTIKVRADVKIPRDADVSVEKGLIGDSALEFVAGAREEGVKESAAIAADEELHRTVRGSMFDRLSESIQKPLDRLARTADKIDALAETWERAGMRVDELLSPRTAAEVDGGKPANIASTIARLDATLAAAQRWAGDEQLKSGVRDLLNRAGAAVADLQTFLQAWTDTADTVDVTAQKLDGVVAKAGEGVDRVTGEALEVLRHVDDAAANLGRVMEATAEGRGTLGQLVTNPDLYRSMTSSAEQLSRVLEELRLLVEKLKAEGLRLKL